MAVCLATLAACSIAPRFDIDGGTGGGGGAVADGGSCSLARDPAGPCTAGACNQGSLCVSGNCFGCANGDCSGCVVDGGTVLTRCFPGDPNPSWQIACDQRTEFCVDNYADAWPGHPTTSCQPLPAACLGDAGCACITGAFSCGISTLCSQPGSIARVTCSPD